MMNNSNLAFLLKVFMLFFILGLSFIQRREYFSIEKAGKVSVIENTQLAKVHLKKEQAFASERIKSLLIR